MEHLRRLGELQANEELMVAKPDKGVGDIVLNRSGYLANMKAMLSDSYEMSTKCPNKKSETADWKKSIFKKSLSPKNNKMS